jgi:hypothetical protein
MERLAADRWTLNPTKVSTWLLMPHLLLRAREEDV